MRDKERAIAVIRANPTRGGTEAMTNAGLMYVRIEDAVSGMVWPLSAAAILLWLVVLPLQLLMVVG